ncbi:MAG: sulfatase-like hydrolase/transferase [Verrucomicrobiota bacterium]
MVEEMDWSVGQVVATLRELGLEKNTLVFFTSDNGAALRKADTKPEVERLMHPDGTYGSNAPLRGGKQDTFEGGVRLPGIAWWPGVIAPRQVVHEPAIVLDLFPTVLELAGAPLPADRVIDGRTLVPVLRGTGRRETTDFYFGSTMLTACRSGRWKLQTVRQAGQAAFNSVRSAYTAQKLISKGPDGLAKELARMEADPSGREFLQHMYGDQEGRTVLGNLKDIANAYTALGDTVNLASRIESLNKIYGTSILATAPVQRAAGSRFAWRAVDRVAVYGRSAPVDLFELLGEESALAEEQRRERDLYERALKDYFSGHFPRAAERFGELLKTRPDHASAALFKARCDAFVLQPPPAGWDGTFVFEQK